MENYSIKILHILKELNISLETLNQELAFLGLNNFDINQRISLKDKDFLVAYFNSEQMVAIDKLKHEMAILHNELKSFYLKHNPAPIDMGKLEKEQYFKFLLGHKNSSAPNVTKFSEEAFWELYNWYINWEKKSKTEQLSIIDNVSKDILEEADDECKTNNRIDSLDYESIYISAIRRGEGDICGF